MGSDDEKPYAKNYIAKVRSTWEKLENWKMVRARSSLQGGCEARLYLLCSCGCRGLTILSKSATIRK